MINESSLLSSIGIGDPDLQQKIMNGSKRLLILDASAHLDWDWLLRFPVLVSDDGSSRANWYFRISPDYPSGCSNEIFEQAIDLLAVNTNHYSICETAFIRGLAATKPDLFTKLVAVWKNNKNLRFTGGGITSPDNLLPHGEAFIRNYLVGHTWLAANFNGMTSPVSCWIPDDFGQDPQLPIVLQAMGMIAAGFARVPGTHASWKCPVSKTPSMAYALSTDNNKIDFTWTAADGSSTIAHWLIGDYSQGNNIGKTSDIDICINTNLGHSPTPYIYVPVLNDFSLPNTQLHQVIYDWIHQPPNNVMVAAASFEDYTQLVQFHTDKLEAPYGNQFNANPYYTGCYGSRPLLKRLHYRATRNLLAAEPLSILATLAQPGGGSNWLQALYDAWDTLVPSTHHDYICGTAIPDVFHTEQTSLLQEADTKAEELIQQTMRAIAGAVNTRSSGATPVVVFNPLGFSRTGIAEIAAADLAGTGVHESSAAYQITGDGGLLFAAAAPSLGYTTIDLKRAAVPAHPASVKHLLMPEGQEVYTIQNGLLTATLRRDPRGVWGLISVVDTASATELIKEGSVANDILFYADGGDEYKFGMEVPHTTPDIQRGHFYNSCTNNDRVSARTWELTNVDTRITNNQIEVLEQGPLRVVVRTSMLYADSNFTITYNRDYILYANEPMLRMRASGAAPMLPAGTYFDSNSEQNIPINGCAVVLSFPLAGTFDSLVRGTPYHWTNAMSLCWNEHTFLPVHNFVMPVNEQKPVCAFYHAAMPAWGLNNQWNDASGSFTNDGTLYACAWRNGDGHYFNWVSDSGTPMTQKGTDPDTHVQEYALRIPSGLQGAATGMPLQESLGMVTPLRAIPAPLQQGILAPEVSLASVNNPAAIITAAKPGSVQAGDTLFRIYQPSNKSMPVTLHVSPLITAGKPGPLTAKGQTALEKDLTPDAASKLNLHTSGNDVSFTMNYALATVAVKGE